MISSCMPRSRVVLSASKYAMRLCRTNKISNNVYLISHHSKRLLSTSSSSSSAPSSSSSGETTSEQKQQQISKVAFEDYDDYDGNNEPEGIADWFTIAMRLALISLGLGCIGLTVNELMPKRMSGTSLFSSAFDAIQNDSEIKYIVGENMKAFGKDIGRNEGRRNQIDSRTYKDPNDNSSRVRVRFNVKGNRGHVVAYAEISENYLQDFVYLICQDVRTGRVVTIKDNRDVVAASAPSSARLNFMNDIMNLALFNSTPSTSSTPSKEASSSSASK